MIKRAADMKSVFLTRLYLVSDSFGTNRFSSRAS